MFAQHPLVVTISVTSLLFACCEVGRSCDQPTATNPLSLREFTKVIAGKSGIAGANGVSDNAWAVVDARATDAFNGWALDGLKRGGHVPGAVDFSASWLDVDLEDRTQRLVDVLQAKGVKREARVAVYSVHQGDRSRVAGFLRQAGYDHVYEFDLNEWVDNGGTLERYPQYFRLVPPSIVKELMDGRRPETFDRLVRVKFVEVSWGDETASYLKGHLPGSFHVNTDHFEPPPAWYLGDPEVLTKFASDYGFQADDTVVISSEDVTASYRLCVVLQYMGVADVRVLNGGLAAWKRAGYPIEMKRHDAPKSDGFGAPIPQQPNLIASTQDVKSRHRKSDEFVLVDTRTWPEFIGETSGYKYHPHKGRIPGAVYGQAAFRGPNSLSPYRNVDDTMRNADEIRQLWQQAGISVDKHLCFMCGGGWRAAEVLTFARVAGNRQTSLYSDGWIGWSNDPGNPIAVGVTTAFDE